MKNTRRISRRHALKAGCAAASLVAPTIVPSSVLGDVDTLPPSERVTLGHVGVGGQGRRLLKALNNLRGEIQSLAVADCFKDRRESIAAQVQGQPHEDFREILDRDDIDGIVVATPDHWHVPIAVMAARAGKDVYLEKPMGLTLEQSLLCKNVFNAEKRIFQYGTQQREAKHMQLGRKIVRSGRLGKLKAIEVKAPDGGTGGSTVEVPVPEGFDYDMWLGPAPKVPYTVDRCKPRGTYWIYDQSIGYLAGWGAHPLDIMIWCYDGDQAGPYSVEGTGYVPTEGLYNTVCNWDVKLQMADGVKVTFKAGTDSTKFIGTDARLELTRSSIRAFPKNLIPEDPYSGDDLGNITRHLRTFANSIRSREPASSPVDESLRSDVISHLSDIAVRTGEMITWDPTKQQIVEGSEQARAMTSRPMRRPWTL